MLNRLKERMKELDKNYKEEVQRFQLLEKELSFSKEKLLKMEGAYTLLQEEINIEESNNKGEVKNEEGK